MKGGKLRDCGEGPALPFTKKYNTLLLDSKATYFNERITECGNDSKAISKIIDLLFRHKTTKLPVYSSAQGLADRFATFFKEKIDKIRDELPDCSDIDLNIRQDKPPSTLSFLQNTTQEDVWKIICKSPSKSCTLDPIPTWTIRDAKNELLPTITDIINTSLRSSEVPTSMKSAVVTPLLKKATLDPEILKKLPPC